MENLLSLSQSFSQNLSEQSLCANCGIPYQPNQNFCFFCGNDLKDSGEKVTYVVESTNENLNFGFEVKDETKDSALLDLANVHSGNSYFFCLLEIIKYQIETIIKSLEEDITEYAIPKKQIKNCFSKLWLKFIEKNQKLTLKPKKEKKEDKGDIFAAKKRKKRGTDYVKERKFKNFPKFYAHDTLVLIYLTFNLSYFPITIPSLIEIFKKNESIFRNVCNHLFYTNQIFVLHSCRTLSFTKNGTIYSEFKYKALPSITEIWKRIKFFKKQYFIEFLFPFSLNRVSVDIFVKYLPKELTYLKEKELIDRTLLFLNYIIKMDKKEAYNQREKFGFHKTKSLHPEIPCITIVSLFIITLMNFYHNNLSKLVYSLNLKLIEINKKLVFDTRVEDDDIDNDEKSILLENEVDTNLNCYLDKVVVDEKYYFTKTIENIEVNEESFIVYNDQNFPKFTKNLAFSYLLQYFLTSMGIYPNTNNLTKFNYSIQCHYRYILEQVKLQPILPTDNFVPKKLKKPKTQEQEFVCSCCNKKFTGKKYKITEQNLKYYQASFPNTDVTPGPCCNACYRAKLEFAKKNN
ncbi:hypothetical protein ABK040_011140 [Willaertia magna]